MKPTEFDSDEILTDFLSDYLDDNLSTAERQTFEEYLAQNRDERRFTEKAHQGKKALQRLAKHINVPSVTA